MARRTHYEVLMLHPRADADIVATVYRRLAKRYHPDRDPSPGARSRMVELNEAYETLRDPERRARYDASLAASRAGPARTVPPPPRGEAARAGSGHSAGGSASAGSVDPYAAAGRAGHGAGTQAPWGEAGAPPAGAASGSQLTFGRYRGWTLGQVGRVDPDFIEWLSRSPSGRAYRDELKELLAQLRRR